MMTYQIDIEPRDVLFFKDAKPLGGSSKGDGASWPLPSTFHSAMMSALYSKWEVRQEWEFEHHCRRNDESDKNFDSSGLRFGGLKTAGPFPNKDGKIYFPTPADLTVVDPNENGGSERYDVMQPSKLPGTSNLPPPLKHNVAGFTTPSKTGAGEWMDADSFEHYLRGNLKEVKTTKTSDLYEIEPRPGVGINPDSRANEDGIFYQASYLRLKEKEKVAMSSFVECLEKRSNKDVLAMFFEAKKKIPFVWGGQRGVAYLDCKRESECKYPSVETTGINVKWVLLSPAIFVKGWLPGWIMTEEDKGNNLPSGAKPGDVLLRPKINGKKTDISAELVAARLNKPFYFSGWRLDKDCDNAGGKPKKTYMAVPAGSVYYFKATTQDDAKRLVSALQGRRRSDFLGEQGFGLGVCGNWILNEQYKELMTPNK